jgi:hypothetical protein
MQLVNGGEPRVWWCPNCGSLKTEGRTPEHEAPRIATMMPEAVRNPHTLREFDREIAAVACLVENYHEIRRGGQPQQVIVHMPESLEPFVVVRFGGLMGGSAIHHFLDSREAAKFYLGGLEP